MFTGRNGRLLLVLMGVLSMLLAACGGDSGGSDSAEPPPTVAQSVDVTPDMTPEIAPEITVEVTSEPVETVPTEVVNAPPIGRRDEACPAIVSAALEAVDIACEGTGRNQVCYGNIRLSAAFQPGVQTIAFAAPGDIVNLSDVSTLQLSPMNTDEEVWGVALMRLQAELQGTVPGQVITFLLFGDVELETAPATDNGVQAFYFRSGIGDAPCAEAPDSGILVQTPTGVGEVALRMNNVDIALGSTAYLQAQPGGEMTISVVEGQAEVSAQGVTETARAGTQTRIELDANRQPISPPTDAQPYNGVDLQPVPFYSLDRQVNIASVNDNSDFVNDADGWTIFADGENLTYFPADTTSDGYICASDTDTGATWYFAAPDSWLGDQSNAYAGELIYALRQASTNSQYDDSEVLLQGGGLALVYDIEVDAHPNTEWTKYTIALSPENWTNTATDEAASEDDLRAVLADLTALYIRGEYVEGNDSGCLDYVQFNASLQPTQSYIPPRRRAALPQIRTPAQSAPIGFQVSDSISTAGEVDTYTFTAIEGQLVYFDGQAEAAQARWSLTGPGGAIFSDQTLLNLGDPGVYTLNAGEYILEVIGQRDWTGAYAFQVWDVPAPQRFTIEFDTPVFDGDPGTGSGHIESPGVQDVYTFNARAGMRMYFDGTGDLPGLRWSLLAPDGSAVFNDASTISVADPGLFVLSESGEYTLIGYGRGDATGLYSFVVWQVPAPSTETIAIGDTVTGALNVPGEQHNYTFRAAAGMTVYFDSLDSSANLVWSLADAEGNVIFADQALFDFVDPGALPLNLGGAYTITVTGRSDNVGTYSFALMQSDAGESSALTPNGSGEGEVIQIIDGEISSPGQEDTFTFALEAGQIVYFDNIAGDTQLRQTLIDPDGSEVFSDVWVGPDYDPGSLEVAVTGEYTLIINAVDETTSPYDVQVWNVPATEMVSVMSAPYNPNAAADDIGIIRDEITVPGQQFMYMLTAEPGQTLYFDSVQGDNGNILWALQDATGADVFSNQWMDAVYDPGRYTLTLGGDYTLTVNGRGDSLGVFAFAIWEVPEIQTYPAQIIPYSVEADPIGGLIAVPGDIVTYTFTTDDAHQTVYFDSIAGDNGNILWFLQDAAGNTIFADEWMDEVYDPGRYDLAANTDYTITVDGRGDTTGEFAFNLWTVPETTITSIETHLLDYDVPFESIITEGEIASPGQQFMYTFAAEAGDIRYFESLEGDGGSIIWALQAPDGELVFDSEWTASNYDPGRYELPQDGEYTVIVEGRGDALGGFGFVIWETLPDVTYSIAVGDTVTIDTPDIGAGQLSNPGEVDRYTFAAEAGQEVYFEALGAGREIRWSLFDPDGDVVFDNLFMTENSDPGLYLLEKDGEYSIVVDGQLTITGQYNFALLPEAPTGE